MIPGAPPGLAGAVNLRGSLVPVLDPMALVRPVATAPARQGDAALLVEDRGVVAALHVTQVHEVATCTALDGHVLDGRGRSLPLLDPRELVRRAVAATQASRGAREPELEPSRAGPDPLVDGGPSLG